MRGGGGGGGGGKVLQGNSTPKFSPPLLDLFGGD
jgi:hypothetical protein